MLLLKVCVSLKKNWSPFWSFPLQIWTFLAFIIRKIPTTFDFIFILLKNTNTVGNKRDRDKKKKEKITRARYIYVCLLKVKKRGLFCYFGSTFFVLSLCLRCLTANYFIDRHKVKQHINCFHHKREREIKKKGSQP